MNARTEFQNFVDLAHYIRVEPTERLLQEKEAINLSSQEEVEAIEQLSAKICHHRQTCSYLVLQYTNLTPDQENKARYAAHLAIVNDIEIPF
jgi:hypothetical protein